MKNQISDLRNHLFATLEALQDEKNPMEIDRARAVADVAKVVVESAKAEIDFMKVTGQTVGSGFIPQDTIEGGRSPLRLAGGPIKDTPLRTCKSCLKKTAQTPCHECGTPWEKAA